MGLALTLPCGGVSAQVVATVSIESGKETLAFNVPAGAKSRVFALASPDRLVVDVSPLSGKPSVMLKGEKSASIKGVRAAWNEKKWRIVFDLSRPMSYRQEALDGKLSVILAPVGEAEPVKKKEPPLVMIDPGHGGQDPGASGPGGTNEKYVTLRYARSLREALETSGKYRVQMTRDDDHFIPLRERVAIARKAKADLFISLHADSAPIRDARGLSVYTVSEKASDKEAEALAERENSADIIAGMEMGDHSEEVAEILISLAQRDTKNKSALLADMLVKSLDTKVRKLQNTHRFAGFAVLKAPDIPSVLVEIGFLSNPKDERLINSMEYQTKLVQSLVRGVDHYFKKRGAK